MQCFLAVDIGASSGRHIAGFLKNGKMELREVYRFPNGFVKRDGRRVWDVDALFCEVVAGLRAAGEQGLRPVSVAVDTWGVDFVLLDREKNRVGDAVAYRDRRTCGVPEALEEKLPFDALYAATGIQKQDFNTIYQLLALKRDDPAQLDRAEHLLMMPDYLNFRLTGEMRSEYTIASTSALLNVREKTWDFELIRRLGLPERLFGALQMPGTAVGHLLPEVREAVGFDTQVVSAAAHDTASAYLAVPARDENAVFLSSGTWSLIGVELSEPIASPESAAANFSNEGGYAGRYRYLKNIMGLWMLQNIRRELGGIGFEEISRMAQENAGFEGRVNVDDARFLAPESMLAAVREALLEQGFADVPDGAAVACVYHSLAASYAQAIRGLSALTGRSFTSLNIVGGGSQDRYLNRLAANATGLPVLAGPTEGTALGNLAAQMIAAGALTGVQHARDVIRESFAIETIEPNREEAE